MTTFVKAQNRLNVRTRRKSKFGMTMLLSRIRAKLSSPTMFGPAGRRPEVLQLEVGERHPDLEHERIERDDRHHEEGRQEEEVRGPGRFRPLAPRAPRNAAPAPTATAVIAGPPHPSGRSAGSAGGAVAARGWIGAPGRRRPDRRRGKRRRVGDPARLARSLLVVGLVHRGAGVRDERRRVGALVDGRRQGVAEVAPVVVELDRRRAGEARSA